MSSEHSRATESAGGTSDAFVARYGADTDFPAPMNAMIEGLLGHRSVRAYNTTALPAGTLEQLIAAAQSAASSSNLQLWSVIAVEDPARKERLAVLAANQKHIAQAPLFLVWLADLSRTWRLGTSRGISMDALNYLEPFVVAVVDAALAAQNAVVAAESLGLGTVYIGALRNHPEKVAAELGLPPMVMPVFGLCVGYADTRSPPAAVKPRLPQSVIVHHERYEHHDEATSVPAYDAAIAQFQAGQGMAQAGWSPAVIKRLGDISGMHGRDRLRAALLALGFELR